MDKNCISTGMCFMPNAETHFDVRCGAINSHRHMLATGTEQGVIIIWNINSPGVSCLKYNISLKRFKELYERNNLLKLIPTFMLVSNNNSVAFPVVQVEFATGGNFNSSLNLNGDGSKDFSPVEFGEDILVSLHEDSTLCIWSLSSYRCLHKIRGPPFPIRSIRVLPDRRFLALVGDLKINIIDLWNIKLTETLEIIDPSKYKSKASSNSVQGLTVNEDESSDSGSSSDIINHGLRIIETACSCTPMAVNEETKKNTRNACPLIFVAITTSNEMLLWDLTSSILSHKSKDPSFNGPVKVITEWDSVYEINVPIFKVPKTIPNNKGTKKSRSKYPTLREYMYELEHETGKVCVMDNYVFLMVGYRILIWYYEAHELTRTAEILSFSDLKFNKTKAKWMGFRCFRGNNGLNLLACWLRTGKMKLFKVPNADSKRCFEQLRIYKFPKFKNICTNVELYFTQHCLEDENIPLYFMYFYKEVMYSRHGFKLWQTHPSAIKLHSSNKIKFTCVVDRGANLTKIELYSDGELEALDVTTHRRERMTSPNIFVNILKNIDRKWKVKPFILNENINDYLDTFENVMVDGNNYDLWNPHLIHCTGEYLVIALESSVLVYSLRSLKAKFLINACHLFRIRSIHNVCSLSGSEKDSELVELPSNFATLDSQGWLVLYNLHDLSKTCKKIENSDHVKINIDEEVIYGDTPIQGESDFDFVGNIFDVSLSNIFMFCSNYTGINRINTHYQLGSSLCIDRLAVDRYRDLLFVLTSTSVFMWRVSSGDFITCFCYLSLYRQAILVSSKGDYKELKSSLSIADTLSLILNRETPSETPEPKMPNYSSSLSLFSEKYKRKLTCNLFLSYLTLSMKNNRHTSVNREYNHTCTTNNNNTQNLIKKKHIFKFVKYNKNILKNFSRCNKHHIKNKEIENSISLKEDNINTFSYSVPVLIFSLELLLSSGNIDFLAFAKDCVFCYLGVANGSLTVPLTYNFTHDVFKMIKIRTSSIFKSLSLDFAHEFHQYPSETTSRSQNEYDNNNKIDNKDKDNKEKMEIMDRRHVKSQEYLQTEDLLLTEHTPNDTKHFHRLNKYLSTCIFLHNSFLLQNHSTFYNQDNNNKYNDNQNNRSENKENQQNKDDKNNKDNKEKEDSEKENKEKDKEDKKERENKNKEDNKGDKNEKKLQEKNQIRKIKKIKSIKESYTDVDLYSIKKQFELKEYNLDVWLMVLIMMNVESEGGFIKMFDSLTEYFKLLDKEELDLLVSRSLANIHVSQSFKLKNKSNIPQIHICKCNSTVFSFGTKCGSCLNTYSDVEYNMEIKNPKNINEDSSLIVLSMISVDNYLYSLKNSIRLGVKHYSLSSYVVQQLMNKLLQLEDNSELIKINQVSNKLSNFKSNGNKGFDLKTFFLEVLSQGFGVVWDLSTFSKQSILPDQIRYTKYSLLLRDDFQSVEGICMDSAYFILYVFHYYHLLRDKCWTKLLLVSCSQNTQLAIDVIGWVVKKRRLGNKAVVSALRLIVEFMDNYSELGFSYLPEFVSVIIKCLDPLDYNIRVKLLKPATNALFYLVKNVPMVDFHQDTQRFAVGSYSGFIVIYDIRSATKWRVFFGKQSHVACVAFGSNGGLLAAYYNQVPCFTVWKCSSSGLIGSLLSNTGKEYKSIKLKPIDVLPTFNQMRNIKIQYKSSNKWFLHREDGRGYMIST